MSPNVDPTRIIISDLHLGKNDDFDIFQSSGKDDGFEAFLSHFEKAGEPVELIINGDFVDFLQLKPWEAYAREGKVAIREQALSKVVEIVKGNARAFRALAKFLANPHTRIVVLLGNHDAELAYDEVWQEVRAAILGTSGGQERLHFVNRATQYNFKMGGVNVHVEHGNIGDPWNEIIYKELFDDAEKNSGFSFPPGTRFVYEVMNRFKESLRFVDLLKPEVPAVPLLLARLEPFQSVKQLPATSLNMMRALKEGFIGRVRAKAHGGTFGEQSTAPPSPEDHLAKMAQLYVQQVDSDPDHLEEFLSSDESATGSNSLEPSFAPRWINRITESFGNALLRLLGRPNRFGDLEFYKVDQTGEDVERARERFQGDVQIVVFGHTHAALKSEVADNRVYINSGTWANLVGLPSGSKDFPAWLDRIATNQFERTSYPTYVVLSPDGSGAKASLNHWSSQGEQTLWSKTITALK